MVVALELYKLSGCSDFGNLQHLAMVMIRTDSAELVLYKWPGWAGVGKLHLHLDLELILQYKPAGRSGIGNL